MVRTKYGMRHSNANGIKQFRTEVSTAATKAVLEQQVTTPLQGALSLSCIFILARPKTVKRLLPFVKPDLDKLIRALCDALTQSGVWVDDAQVTQVKASKVYASPSNHPIPGVIVSIAPVESELDE